MNSSEKISGEFVVARGDGSKVLEFIEEALDEIAFAIEREIAIPLDLAVGLRRDNGGDFPLVQRVYKRIGVEGLVAEQGIRLDVFNQRLRANEIMSLTWREHYLDGITQGIDERVDFGAQSAARSADRLFTVFFRAPALC